MSYIRLLFGRPAIRDSAGLLSALRGLQDRHCCIVQALDADLVVSERHILFAVKKALSAISEGRNIAKDPGMEIMRYASGERQIERALDMGISDSTERIALVLVSPCDTDLPDSLDLSCMIEQDGMGCSYSREAVMEAFNISREELEAAGEGRIEDLVIERVALVDTYR